jgi:1-acyl-sn-glycerol-3-phosphate acyltransferase
VGVTWLPLYHDMGLIGCWFGSLYHAFPLTVMSPLSFLNRPERWLWAIHYHRGTLSAGPNFAYELCVRKIEESSIQGLDLSSWRLAFNGAEAVNPKTLERFIKKFEPYGLRREAIYPVYGLAETCVALTFPPLEQNGPIIDTIDRHAFEVENRAMPVENNSHTLQFVSCGVPIPEHDVRIVNENGEEVNERVIGSLHFSGPSSMQGYYRNLAATQAVYHEGWWDSGDYAYKANGEIYITGRKKDTIIKAGRNLYPQEIEEVAAQINGVRKGCVVAFGLIDQKLGTEKLIVVAETIETKASVRSQMIHDITEKISTVVGLPPDEVILVEPRTIPKTSSGKLQRSLCKNMFTEKQLKGKRLPIWLQMTRLYIRGKVIGLSHIVQKGFEYLYTGYVSVLSACFLPSVWLLIMILPKQTAIRSAQVWVKLFLALAFCRLDLKEKEKLTSHPSMIFIANHASYLDSLVLFSILPDNVVFTGKKELMNWPLVGGIFRKLQYLSIDRLDFSKSLTDTQHIINVLQEGRSILIFPEGTFTYATGLRPFKLGAFKVAVDTGFPICPIALKGTRAIFRGDKIAFKAGTVNIVVNEPLIPKAKEWSEVMHLHTLARADIAKHCGELMIDLISAGPDPDHHA